MEVVAIFVAILSLIVSGWAAWESRHANTKSDEANELAKRAISIEEKRDQRTATAAQTAIVTAAIESRQTSSGPKRYLVIRNTGQGHADRISVQVDGTPLHQHPAVHVDKKREMLGPGGEHVYSSAASSDSPSPKRIVIEWTNESGEPGRYTSDL